MMEVATFDKYVIKVDGSRRLEAIIKLSTKADTETNAKDETRRATKGGSQPLV